MRSPCPACRTVALEVWSDPASQLEIDSCPECHGFWFDGEELGRLFPNAELLGRAFEQEQRAAPRPPGGQRECPRCRMPLKQTSALEVPVDVCRRCRGIWLDPGELMALVERYPGRREGDLMVLNQIALGLARSETRTAALQRLLQVLAP